MLRHLDEMKLARVIDACDGIDGRVKMQKIVCLLQAMDYDLPFDDFIIRQHGPYSRGVGCSADILTGAGFVEETPKPLGPDEFGEPIVQYSYTLREDLRDFVREHFDVASPEGKPPLDEVATELKKRERKVLEVAATRVYLEREEGRSGDDLETELKKLKGHLASSFAEADELLADLSKRGWL